ncbi:hypothetical protein D9M68_845920 [compost metagenome]
MPRWIAPAAPPSGSMRVSMPASKRSASRLPTTWTRRWSAPMPSSISPRPMPASLWPTRPPPWAWSTSSALPAARTPMTRRLPKPPPRARASSSRAISPWAWSCWPISSKRPPPPWPITTLKSSKCTTTRRSTPPRARHCCWAKPLPRGAKSPCAIIRCGCAMAIPARAKPAPSALPPCAAAMSSAIIW